MQRCIYSIIAKEYRSSNVGSIELRFNPMKRNKSGEMDLDHIIQATVHGLDQAVLDYGAKAGLIFCLAREFPFELNEIIVRKAIRYHKWGVVGIDMAGPEKRTFEQEPDFKRYVKLLQEAKAAGLGITIHTGETDATGPESVRQVLRDIKPDRIGHGIQVAKDEELMQELAAAGTVLELCPSSNVQTKAVSGWDEFKDILNKFKKFGIKFTINTDGPYLLRTNMKKELELLLEHKVLTEAELKQAMQVAREASFIKS
ncbi:MAG: adenosine deaminase, partial [Candidatus Veblenbacteria bacterium]|nr:adenosine deaminase [Candidatus Veblenbacteria bacterium]